MTPEKWEMEALQQMITEGKINRTLYKYREIGDYTEKIFTDHTLWFDHPINFNDPFDCWANIQEIDRAALEKFIIENSPSNYYANRCKQGIPSYTTKMLKQEVDRALNEIGVCCFSTTEKSILMWSHYCKYHQGICLEFDILEDPSFFTLAKPVNYVDVMPQYDHFTEFNKLFEKLIQPKAIDWEYEEEVRVIKTPQDISRNNGSQAFKFSPNALRKVIFGCKSQDETIAQYKELCRQNGLSHVTFSKMYQKQNGQFELEEHPI